MFVSEILSAKTLAPIVRELIADPNMTVDIVNDGFCEEFIRTLELPVEYLLEDFRARIQPRIERSSLVLMGKSYVEPAEYDVLRCAADYGVPVFMVIPDMGIEIVRAKLSGIGDYSRGDIPWPQLLVADQCTASGLATLGVPQHKISPIGNPYFDELYTALESDSSEWCGSGLGYFSTPFELDCKRGILPAEYSQRQLFEDISGVAEALKLPLTVKRHPQVSVEIFGGRPLFEGTPLDMIRKVRIAIGSYSTTLLEAFAAGIPTISYQPWMAVIRNDVFDGRIPVAKSIAQLHASLEALVAQPQVRLAHRHITYNPKTSLREAAMTIRRELERNRSRVDSLPMGGFGAHQ